MKAAYVHEIISLPIIIESNGNFPACCPDANKVAFQIPADTCAGGHRKVTQLKIGADGLSELKRVDPLPDTPSGNIQQMPNPEEFWPEYDFPDQIIKMRVCKIVELPERKTNLEINFATPRDKPNLYSKLLRDTVHTQSPVCCKPSRVSRSSSQAKRTC